MRQYMCEASASCESFQLAICLHCNLRLCLLHINEHNQSIYDRVQNARVEVESASLYVQETFREHRTTLVQAVTSVEEWRRKQIEEIEQNYLNEMQSLQLKQSMLDNTQEMLLNQLERDARQVLDKLAWQQNANLDILHAVQHTIETVRHEAVKSIEIYSVKPTTAEEHRSPAKAKPPIPANHQNYARPIKRLVDLFNQTASMRQTKTSINTFIRKRGKGFRVSVLISSYLTAWHQIVRVKRKELMLTEHVSTIQKYLNRRHRDHRDIFVALQSFLTFVNVTRAQGYEMMGVLLQHFLNYHFIRQEHLIEWYERDNNRDIGYERARIWAIPTIQSFPRMESDDQEPVAATSHIKRENLAESSAREEKPLPFLADTDSTLISLAREGC